MGCPYYVTKHIFGGFSFFVLMAYQLSGNNKETKPTKNVNIYLSKNM